MVKPCIRAPHITSCLLSSTLSRCSKLFYTISRCYFHIESTFSGASISFVLSHIARYVPSPEENSCIPITHFQCKNNFEHLLIKIANPSKGGHHFISTFVLRPSIRTTYTPLAKGTDVSPTRAATRFPLRSYISARL